MISLSALRKSGVNMSRVISTELAPAAIGPYVQGAIWAA